MRTRLWSTLVFLILGLLFAVQAQAFCGFYAGKADASLFNQASQVAIARDGERTVLTMLNDYQGPLNQFVLVVPTPALLKEGQVSIADKAVFEHMDSYSSPRLAGYKDPNPCHTYFRWGFDPAEMVERVTVTGSAVQKADVTLGVAVSARFTLGEYDIVLLSAQQSDGLETWLHQNGYKIPQGASAALRPYIKQGMKFFVAKVNLKEQAKTGYSTLRPLQFAFESNKFMLPMRLGMLNAAPGQAQDLIVYLMTRNGRVESSNYRTVKLPSDVDVPQFIKPSFGDFYKAMFDTATKAEQYRAVFTEYFWDMNSCDPCAAEPLTTQELLKAGVFWLEGQPARDFAAMQNGKTLAAPSQDDGIKSVMLTRVHIRYTPESFPEDLMFTETRDDGRWQARYIVREPYVGSVAACAKQVAGMDCEAMCKERVTYTQEVVKQYPHNSQYNDKSSTELQADCMNSCRASKNEAISTAVEYYTKVLPERAATEKQTLAKLTGWSMHKINNMPGADSYGSLAPAGEGDAVASNSSWWQRLLHNQ